MKIRLDWAYLVPAICWALAVADLVASCAGKLEEPAWVETVSKTPFGDAQE